LLFFEELCPPRSKLKSEFQPKLKNSRVVSIHGMEKRTSSKAIHGRAVQSASANSRIISCGRITVYGPAVASDHVVAGISRMGGVVNPELRVVENVERLGAEFNISLAENLEMFQQGKIEICAPWIIH
jgi:hypothetical protein